MKRPPISGSPERFVSWWIQWSDLNWPNPDNFDAIRRRADLMAESNASTALVFGTHFRWDWLPYWEILHDYLATVADELHRRGLKLFDHHSTVLIHRYDTREEMRNVILHSQPHLPFSPSREAAATWTFRGRRLNDWRTVDTVTRRTLYYPQYAAEGFCHRNPEFMDSYREYVKKLLADTHVDGLMCDDAQHFMHYRSCACPVCLAAFRERAGIELPDADDATFWGNWDNPAWKMWIDLRYEATTEFQRAVRSVLPPDFPQMSCSINSANATSPCSGNDAVCFLAGGCTRQNLELCGNTPPYKHDPETWNQPIANHFVNASYNAAAARKHGARCYGVGYGFVEATANIVWAVNKCLGADCWFSTLKGRLGLPASELAKLPDDFTPARRAFGFEKAHPELFAALPVHQAGVFFSRETRDHTLFGSLQQGVAAEFKRTVEQLAGAGISAGTVLRMPEDTTEYGLLVIPGAAALTEEEITRLRRFANAGGRVLITGPSGLPECASPWKLANAAGKRFWDYVPETVGKGRGVMRWTLDDVPAPDLADADWREVAPGIFYHPGRLSDGKPMTSLTEKVRAFARPLPVKLFHTEGLLTSLFRSGKDYIAHFLAADFDTDIDRRLDGMRTHRSRVNFINRVEPVGVPAWIGAETDLHAEIFTPFSDRPGDVTKTASGTLRIDLPPGCAYFIVRFSSAQ